MAAATASRRTLYALHLDLEPRFFELGPSSRRRCVSAMRYAPAHHCQPPAPGSKTQSPNGNRISKLITAVYKVNRQDKTRHPTNYPINITNASSRAEKAPSHLPLPPPTFTTASAATAGSDGRLPAWTWPSQLPERLLRVHARVREACGNSARYDGTAPHRTYSAALHHGTSC